MKTSTKILLAGIIPVLLFAAVNICVNRARAERLEPQVKELAAELTLKTIRVVDIRGAWTPEELQALRDYHYSRNGGPIVSRASGNRGYFFESGATPSSDWLRRSGDTLIVNYSAGSSLAMSLPEVEELIMNGTTIRIWEPEKEEETPKDDH